MKIGISLSSTYLTEETREGPVQMLARTKAAASAGLDSLFVGDHHSVPVSYYQNTPILGRLLAEWDERTAGALFLLPLWNPVLVAEQVATLACITKGRFIMQCGLGGGAAQFNAMGVNIRHRPSAFEQSIETIRALWQGETVNLDGRWHIQQAKIAPMPPEPVDIWIGASAQVAIERAAKLGDAWLASPDLTEERAKQKMDIYLTALARHHRPVPATIAIRRDIYVAESAAEAARVKETMASSGYRGFDPSALVIGDPASVAARFLELGKAGYTDIIVRNLHTDPEKAVASTRRLASVRSMIT